VLLHNATSVFRSQGWLAGAARAEKRTRLSLDEREKDASLFLQLDLVSLCSLPSLFFLSSLSLSLSSRLFQNTSPKLQEKKPHTTIDRSEKRKKAGRGREVTNANEDESWVREARSGKKGRCWVGDYIAYFLVHSLAVASYLGLSVL